MACAGGYGRTLELAGPWHPSPRACRYGLASGWPDAPDLEGAEEPDLSVTPFSNTFPIRRAPEGTGVCLTLDTAFIDGPALTVTRSTQRYDRQGPGRLRYVDVDLGLARGLVADLVVDDRGLVLSYEHLFERVSWQSP